MHNINNKYSKVLWMIVTENTRYSSSNLHTRGNEMFYGARAQRRRFQSDNVTARSEPTTERIIPPLT